MEVLNEWECSHSSKLKILMVTINSLVMPYQSVAVLALRLVIEYLQISYLLFKPNTSIWNFEGFDQPRRFIFMIGKLANVTPFVIEENYIVFYNLLIFVAVVLVSILGLFIYYYCKKRKNLDFSNIFIEKLLRFLFSIVPVLLIPLTSTVIPCLYCVNNLSLVEPTIIMNKDIVQSKMTGNNPSINSNIICYTISHFLVLFAGIIVLVITILFVLVHSLFYFNFDNYSTQNKESCYNPKLQIRIVLFKFFLALIIEFKGQEIEHTGLFTTSMIFLSSMLILYSGASENYLIQSKGRKLYLWFSILVCSTCSIMFIDLILHVFNLGDYFIFECFIIIMVMLSAFMIYYKTIKIELLVLNNNLSSSAHEALQKIMFLHKLIVLKRESSTKYMIELLGYLTHHEYYCDFQDCFLKIYKQRIIERFQRAVTKVATVKNPDTPTKKRNVVKFNEKREVTESNSHLKKNILSDTIYSFHSFIHQKKAEIGLSPDVNADETVAEFNDRIYQYLIFHQESMFENTIRRFPFNFELKFYYIMFLVNVYNNYDKAKHKLIELEAEMKLSTTKSYMVFIIQNQICSLQREQALQLGLEMNISKNPIEIRNVILYYSISTKFKEDLEKISSSFVDFWSNFTFNSQSLQDIKRSGLILIGNIKSLFVSWNKLESLNLADSEVLWLYGFFLCDILDEKSLGQKFLEKSKASISNFKDNTLNFNINTVLSKGSNVCLASAKEREGAIIIRVSASFARTFGYCPSEMEGKNTNILLPTMFHTLHNMLILEFTVKNKFDSRKTINGYSVHKSGYLLPTHTNLTKIPSFKFDNCYLVRVIQTQYSNYVGHVLTDKNMNMCYVSTEIPRMFEINEKETLLLKNSYKLEQKDKFNLTEFVQEMQISIEDFIEHEKEREELVKQKTMNQLKVQIQEEECPKLLPRRPKREILEKESNVFLKRIVQLKLGHFKSEGKFVKSHCNLLIGNFNRKANSYGVIQNEYLKFITEKYNNSRKKKQGLYGKFLKNLRLRKMVQNSSNDAIKHSDEKVTANKPSSLLLINTRNCVEVKNSDNKVDKDNNSSISHAYIEMSKHMFGPVKTDYYAAELSIDYDIKKYTYTGINSLKLRDFFQFHYSMKENHIALKRRNNEISYLPPEMPIQSGFFPGLEAHRNSQYHLQLSEFLDPKHSKMSLQSRSIKNILKNSKNYPTSPSKNSNCDPNTINSEANAGVCSNMLNNRKVFNSIFSVYSAKVILFKIDLSTFTMKRELIEEKLSEQQILSITQDTIMLRDDYEVPAEEDSIDGDNNKIEVRKSEIFSRSILLKNTKLSFLKFISASIIFIHFFLTLLNYHIISSNINHKYSLLRLTFNIGKAVNYSMGIVDPLLNCILIQDSGFMQNNTQLTAQPYKSTESVKSDLIDTFLNSIKLNSINLYNVGNLINFDLETYGTANYNQSRLLWNLSNLVEVKSQSIEMTVNVRFVEAVTQLSSTAQLLSLGQLNQNLFKASDTRVFFILHNFLNSFYSIQDELETAIDTAYSGLDTNVLNYIILAISTSIIFVMVLICFILLIKTVLKIQKISTELLSISSNEAKGIISASQNFTKLVKQQLDKEDIEYVEDEIIQTGEKYSKSSSKIKYGIAKSSIFSLCLIFTIYFVMMFIHHIEIILNFNSLSSFLRSNFNEARSVNTFIQDSYLPSVHTKLSLLDEPDIFSLIPIKFSKDVVPLFTSMIESYENITPIISKFNSSLIMSTFSNADEDFHKNRSEATVVSLPEFFVFDSSLELINLRELPSMKDKFSSKSAVHIITNAEETVIPLYSLLVKNYQETIFDYVNSSLISTGVWFFVATTLIVILFISMWLPSEKYILADNTNLMQIILLLPNKILRRRPKMISIMKEENLISYSSRS